MKGAYEIEAQPRRIGQQYAISLKGQASSRQRPAGPCASILEAIRENA
jgi:hypothetical protein